MLYPLLLALFERVLRRGWRRLDLAVFTLLCVALFMPVNLAILDAGWSVLILLAVLAGGALLLMRPAAPRPA